MGPLIALTKKYARFKEQFTDIPLLNFPDLTKPFILYTDATDKCIGAIFTQPYPNREGPVPGIPEEVPVYFLSHRLRRRRDSR